MTDAGLEQLIGLTKLEDLDLQNTRVTKGGEERLRAVLPKFKIPTDEMPKQSDETKPVPAVCSQEAETRPSDASLAICPSRR